MPLSDRSNFNASRNLVGFWLNDALQPRAAELRGHWWQVSRRGLSPAAQDDQEVDHGSDRHALAGGVQAHAASLIVHASEEMRGAAIDEWPRCDMAVRTGVVCNR